MFWCKVDNVDQTIRVLAEVKEATVRGWARSGLRKAMRVMAKEAKALTPRETGTLQKALSSTVKTESDKRLIGWVFARGIKRSFMRGKRGKLKNRTGSQLKAGTKADQVRNASKYLHLVTGGRKALEADAPKIRTTKRGKEYSAGAMKVLRFISKSGQIVFARRVEAVKPRDFLKAVASRNKDLPSQMIDQSIRAGLAKREARAKAKANG